MNRNKESTELGRNRTGISLNPAEARKTYEGAQVEATKGSERLAADMRALIIAESPGMGSLPEAADGANRGRRMPQNGPLGLLLDKLSERAAFERTGVRLYEAFLVKLRSGNGRASSMVDAARRIRDQELDHFRIVCREIRKLGGDETVMSPCADSTGVASRGIMQVLCDPRSTVAQSISALLTAELTDNAGWDLLIGICTAMGLKESAAAFEKPRQQEREHLARIRGWLAAVISEKLPKRPLASEEGPSMKPVTRSSRLGGRRKRGSRGRTTRASSARRR